MDPEKMREAVAAEMGVKLYALYTMVSAAMILCGTEDTTSIKRWKKSGLLESVAHGDRGVRFFGYQLVDFYLKRLNWNGVERRQPNQPRYNGVERRKAS